MTSISRYAAQAEINRQSSLSGQMAKLQEQVSSEKRISVASDDPAAAARIADIRQAQADQAVWTGNVNTGTAIASAADSNLSSVANLINSAKDLLLSGRNDATATVDRSTIASQIRALATTLDTYAKAKDPTGAPLFPTGDPLTIPVSATLNLPATATRDAVFGQVAVGNTTKSLADILNDAADSLEVADPTQRTTRMDASLDALDDGINHLAQARADQGVRAQRFDQAKASLASNGDALTTERSTLEDTDLTYALSAYQQKKLSLDAAQAVFAQSTKSSLFDLIG